MKKLLFYPSQHPDEHVVYEFDSEGKLRAFEINKKMTDEQFGNFRKWLPYTEQELHCWVQELRVRGIKYRLIEGVLDLSFENFYNQYAYNGGEKRNRLNAERAWKRLGEADKVNALRYISKYMVACKNSGIGIKYPDTYINQRAWND